MPIPIALCPRGETLPRRCRRTDGERAERPACLPAHGRATLRWATRSAWALHPCTTFDKWRWMPVVDAQYRVVDALVTCF
jgi:D-serine dehydratase